MSKKITLNKEHISDLYLFGMSLEEISNMYNVSRPIIARHLMENGTDIRKTIKVDINKLSKLCEAGLSLREMGDSLGVSMGIVEQRLDEFGIRKIKRLSCVYKNKEWLEDQYINKKKSQGQIALENNVETTTIGNWLDRFCIGKRAHGLSLHLAKGNSLEISEDTNDFITGLLLGDGHISSDCNYSARYQHSDKHKEYLISLSSYLDSMLIKQSGKISKQVDKRTGKTTYRYQSKSYDGLVVLRTKWYPFGEKIVPRDTILSPIACNNWMIGDGYLEHKKKCRPSIVLCTGGFAKKDIMFLIDLLKELNINSTYRKNNNNIAIGVDHTSKFLDYIGPCPEEIWNCYGYKWDLTRTKKEWEAEFCPTVV